MSKFSRKIILVLITAVFGLIGMLFAGFGTNLITRQQPQSVSSFLPNLQVLVVPASAQAGLTYSCQNSGNHIVTITSGAYSPWSDGSRQWRTLIYIYVNRDIVWGNRQGHIEPAQSDAAIGQWEGSGNSDNQKTAAEVGHGNNIDVYCNAGQQLHFVAIDDENSYAGNQGSVQLSIQPN